MPAPAYSITYRTDDSTAWGPGVDRILQWYEVDRSFWNLNFRVSNLEVTAGIGKQIDYIAESNGALFVHYTDHSIDGPFPIPSPTINWRGAWLPNVDYVVGDMIQASSTVYQVQINHISATTFDPNATDGSGHNLYKTAFRITAIGTRTVTTATFTPDITFANSYIRCTNATGCVVTIPPDSAVTWANDDEMHFRDCTSSGGMVDFVQGSGVTINGIEGRLLSTASHGAVVGMKHVGVSTWDLWGLLAP